VRRALRAAIARIRDALRAGDRAGPPPRCAGVYLRGADIIVHAKSQTTDGVWILAEPVTQLEAGCSDGALGGQVRAALRASRCGVPRPKAWAGLVEPLLKAARVRSYKRFVDGAWYVTVDEGEGGITLTPTRNQGAKEGFAEDGDAASVVPGSATDAALGAEVRTALGRAT
jgi:hypothetical protein